MRKIGLFLICSLLIVEISGCKSKQQIRLCRHPVKVIAHRGVHNSVPENTLAAIRAALKLGLDYVEVDVRTTADKRLILMHDKNINRTTTGAGLVANLKLEQIRKVFVKGPEGQSSTSEKVPLLCEALQCMRGRINVYVDMKNADYKAVFAELEKRKMLDDAVIYMYEPWEKLLKIKTLYPNVNIMPEVDSEDELAKVMKTIQPRIVAMSWRGFSEELVQKIHQAGAQVFLDVLGPGDNPEGVHRAIDAGVDGIQTDDPDMVLRVIHKISNYIDSPDKLTAQGPL